MKYANVLCFVVLQAALAHLESLSIDVEQAHPPATEQIIDCLPQITINAENIGTTSFPCSYVKRTKYSAAVSKCLIV